MKKGWERERWLRKGENPVGSDRSKTVGRRSNSEKRRQKKRNEGEEALIAVMVVVVVVMPVVEERKQKIDGEEAGNCDGDGDDENEVVMMRWSVRVQGW